ncbi:MAG: hypothetical protein AABX72_04185, partial [Nanoarchaeota archaeon]
PFIGLILGYVLRRIAPEEANQGKKYFIKTQQIILFLLVIVLLWISPLTITTAIAFIVGILIAKLIRFRYLYLGGASVATMMITKETALLVLTLIFLYGLPFGTQVIKKNPTSAVVRHAILFAIPFVLLVTPFASSPLLSPLIAGALFLRK